MLPIAKKRAPQRRRLLIPWLGCSLFSTTKLTKKNENTPKSLNCFHQSCHILNQQSLLFENQKVFPRHLVIQSQGNHKNLNCNTIKRTSKNCSIRIKYRKVFSVYMRMFLSSQYNFDEVKCLLFHRFHLHRRQYNTLS